MNVDGSDVRRLTNLNDDNYDPEWSPDGKRTAFVPVGLNEWNIYTMRTDGSALQKLTNRAADKELHSQ